ncbi:unnamed protein product [Peniophora sp. CBMAI 1063]|nr:unnamed protein product [Peniophora sp. CBMAI 1063]
MSLQQPPTSDFKLPSEIWFNIFDILFPEYIEEAERKGRDYLPHYILLPSAPWNVLSRVCRRARDLVRNHSAHVTMLRPDLTSNALKEHTDGRPLDFHYTDIDDWATFDREYTFDFSIPAAVKLALDTLPKAKTFAVFAQTAVNMSGYASLAMPPGYHRGLSKVEKVDLLSNILGTLSTTPDQILQELRIFTQSDMMLVDGIDPCLVSLRASERLLWTCGAHCFPELKYLALSGLFCTVPPRLPPSLTKLKLSCTFTTSMDDLLDMLHLLPHLRNLALSNCAHGLPSIIPDRHMRHRYVRLPHLHSLALQERLAALTIILFHLDFRPTTCMDLKNHGPYDRGVNAAETISAFAREVQSHLDPGSEEEMPAFESLEINLWKQVNAFDLHAKAGEQTLDIWLDWTYAEDPGYDGLCTFLKELHELHSVWRLDLAPGIYLSRSRWDARPLRLDETLLCLSEVEELSVQMRLTPHVCYALRYAYPDGSPVLFPVLQKLIVVDELEMDASRVVKSLGTCIAGRSGVLDKVVFVSCPRLSGCTPDRLALGLEGVSIDLSEVDKMSALVGKGVHEADSKDTEWDSDSDDDAPEDDSLVIEPVGIPIPIPI